MTIIYVVHALHVVRKKRGGFGVKQVVYGTHTDPSKANQEACEVIAEILKKEKYFCSDGDSDKSEHKTEMDEIMNSNDPPASKYYDMVGLLDKWAPDVSEISIKKYDVRVSESNLVQ
jgi:hypothetical protein